MPAATATAHRPVTTRQPRWDATARQLWWCGKVIRTYRYHADNQRRLLKSFHDAGWAPHIDDPLPRHSGICRKDRLRETVRSLNRGLRGQGIRFRMDGTTRGVFWESVM